MIEGARQLAAQVLTASAINAQIAALNTRMQNSAGWLGAVPLLPTSNDPRNHGVQDMWHKTYRELTRPGVGYMVAVLRSGKSALKSSGNNRMTIPLWIECHGKADDQETTLQHAGIISQAVLYVLETLEGQTLANVTPPIGCVLVEEGDIEAVNIDAAAAGKLIGVRTKYNITIDDARS